MITVTVGTSGLDFDEVARKMSGPLRQKFLIRVAQYAYNLARQYSPFHTGELYNSHRYGVRGNQAYVEATAPHAIFVVKGTRPHIIRPLRARVLAFEADTGIVHSVRVTRFAKIVHHPGTKPYPYIAKAAERTRDQVERIFAQTWLEEL